MIADEQLRVVVHPSVHLAEAGSATVATSVQIPLFDDLRDLWRWQAVGMIAEEQKHHFMEWLVTRGDFLVRPDRE